MKVFGGQTKTEISTERNVPHFTWEMVILLSKINKYQCLYIILFLNLFCNIVILFTHFLVKKNNKKNLKNQICVVTPVVTVFFLRLSAVSHKTEVQTKGSMITI